MKKRFIRDQTAEGYIDVAITMLIVFTLMASLMALFPIFTAQQSLNQTARYMARTVELYGKADDATLSFVTEGENFTVPDSIKVETQWHDAGDLVFFVGTYDTPGVSHVGIYVGDGMMIHAGNPIHYSSINTSYYQEHFYAFGRLPL
jgi:hypothetical protein